MITQSNMKQKNGYLIFFTRTSYFPFAFVAIECRYPTFWFWHHSLGCCNCFTYCTLILQLSKNLYKISTVTLQIIDLINKGTSIQSRNLLNFYATYRLPPSRFFFFTSYLNKMGISDHNKPFKLFMGMRSVSI